MKWVQMQLRTKRQDMTNPLWPPHARFHWSIQWYSITLLNLGALFLLWGAYRDKGTRLSVVSAGMAPLLFWGSFFPSMLMPGTSTWPDGIVPFTPVAPNVILAMVLSIMCSAGIYRDACLRRRRDNDSGVIPR